MIESVYFYAAVIGGTLLAVQVVLMVLGVVDGGESHGTDFSDGDVGNAGGLMHGDSGAGHGHSLDAGSHSYGHWFYEKLSLRTISAGLTFFGLVGKTALARGMHAAPALVLSLLSGYAALAGVYWLFKQVYRFEHAGNENVRLAIGLPAVVYVPIPELRSGRGKVTFRLQNRIVEYEAVTDDATRLATGEKVRIEDVLGPGTVRVVRDAETADS